MQYIFTPAAKPSQSPFPSEGGWEGEPSSRQVGEGAETPDALGAMDARFYAWFPAMHSRVDLLLVADRSEDAFRAMAEEIRQAVARLEQLANCYDPVSPLARHNADQSLPVPDELRGLLTLSKWYKEQTLGLFDPWFAGRCNLSAFLKGYALDTILPLLTRHGITNAVVSMGNSSILFLKEDRVLTTSGNATAERRHIVNPLTGQYVEGRRTVSVETPTQSIDPDGTILGGGALGEVLSTALFVADDEQRRQLLQRFPQARRQPVRP